MVPLIEEMPLFNVSKRDSQMLLQFTCLFMPAHLNQIEIYFAIVQRKALTPNDFPNLEAVKKRLLDFQTRYQEVARPFHWKFTRKDLKEKLKLVSDNLIKQYEPVVFEDVVTEEFLSQNQAEKPQSVYAYT